MAIINLPDVIPALDATTAINIGGFQCWEESCTEEFATTGATAARVIYCIWTDRVGVVTFLRNPSITTSGSILVLSAGQPYPDAPWLYAKTIKTEGVGSPGLNTLTGQVGYHYAKLLVYYETDWSPFETGSIDIDFGVDIVTIPQDATNDSTGTQLLSTFLKWSSGTDNGKGVPIGNAPPFVIPVASITRTVTRLQYLPLSKIGTALAAPVNSVDISLSPSSFALNNTTTVNSGQPAYSTVGTQSNAVITAGTALYEGTSSNKVLMTGGYTSWTIAHRFKWRPLLPWNSLFNRDGTVNTFTKEDGNKLFPTSDLSNLFSQ